MKAITLVNEVVKLWQKESIKHCVPIKKTQEYIKSRNFFEMLFNTIIEDAEIHVNDYEIQIIKPSSKVSSINLLDKEILNGYWVYTFYFSVDYYNFKHFKSKNAAVVYYKSQTQDTFCGDKALFLVKQTYIQVLREEL